MSDGEQLVAAYLPADQDEERLVLAPETSRQEVAVPATSLCNSLPQAVADGPAFIIVVVAIRNLVAQRPAHVPTITESIHDFGPTIPTFVPPVLNQVHEHVAPVRTIAHPVPQKVAHALIILVPTAQFLLLGGRGRSDCWKQGRGGDKGQQ